MRERWEREKDSGTQGTIRLQTWKHDFNDLVTWKKKPLSVFLNDLAWANHPDPYRHCPCVPKVTSFNIDYKTQD